MATFLFKTEPSEYDFARLQREGHAVWDGITNNAALAFLRRARRGDRVFIYHTGGQKAIVGEAEVTGEPREDRRHPGRVLSGPDAGLARFAVVEIRPLKPAAAPLTLDHMKADKRFAAKGFELFRQPRLSVLPVPDAVASEIRRAAGL